MNMNLKFKPVTAEDIAKIIPFFGLRPDKTCESVFLDSFLWRDYYHIQYTIYEEKGLLWKMEQEGKTYTSIPSCRQEDLPELLGIMKDYFNQTLGEPLRIYLADEESLEFLKLDPAEFSIEEAVDLKDYLYDGEAMRTLSGRKLHKKKNRVNSFIRTYEGRYEFRRLCCSDRQDVWEFLDKWRAGKNEPEEVMEGLDEEIVGIHRFLRTVLISRQKWLESILTEISRLFLWEAIIPERRWRLFTSKRLTRSLMGCTSLLTSSSWFMNFRRQFWLTGKTMWEFRGCVNLR